MPVRRVMDRDKGCPHCGSWNLRPCPRRAALYCRGCRRWVMGDRNNPSPLEGEGRGEGA